MHIPETGDVVAGRYVLGDTLGAGGFAQVYASKLPDGTACAVKVLIPEGFGYEPDIIARFRREVEILRTLRSPHTVRLFDHGQTEDGVLFAVFEFVPGRDLGVVLDEDGPMTPRLAVHILRQVLYALAEAHNASLMHRDIKPENIRIFALEGEPVRAKLLDFGIAKARADGEAISVTKTGELVGTPRYMSPEQLLDQPLLQSSDIYSLGLVMFEVLMGREVLGGNGWADQLGRLRSGYVFSIPQMEYVGSGLMTVLTRMTAREPGHRYPNAEAVIRALDAIERGQDPSMPIPVPVPDDRTGPSAKVSVVVAAALILIAVSIFVAVQAHLQPPTTTVTPQTRTLVHAEIDTPPRTPVDKKALRPAADAGPIDIRTDESGCGKRPPFRGVGRFGLTQGIEIQEWVGFIPRKYDPQTAYPLLIALHMNHKEPDDFLAETRLDKVADEIGAIVVAPHDTDFNNAWDDASDILKIQSTVEETIAQVCVDRSRVFAVGHNNGGKAVERLSCEPWIRATAVTSHRPNKERFLCAYGTELEPAPHLVLAPLKSGHLPVDGGINCYNSSKISLADHEKRWRERNHCKGRKIETFAHSGGRCWRWECDQPLQFCHLEGGQGWPGSPPRYADLARCDGTPPDFPSEKVIWDFFSTFDSEPTPLDGAE